MRGLLEQNWENSPYIRIVLINTGDIDAHQLLRSSVLHKPGTMARTAWTVDGYP